MALIPMVRESGKLYRAYLLREVARLALEAVRFQMAEEAFDSWSDGRLRNETPSDLIQREALQEGFLAGFGKGFRAGGSYVGREMREKANGDGDEAEALAAWERDRNAAAR